MQFGSFPDLAQIFPGLGPHREHDFSDLAIEISRMVGATITSTDFPAASVCVWHVYGIGITHSQKWLQNLILKHWIKYYESLTAEFHLLC